MFPSDLKLTDVIPSIKGSRKTPKITIDQLAYYLIFPKFKKYVSMIKFSSFLILDVQITMWVWWRLQLIALLDNSK